MSKLLNSMFFSTIIIISNLFCTFDYFPQEEHVETYLSQMPWKFYHQYEVDGLGKFWVDDAYDCVKDTIKSGKMWETYIINKLKKVVKKGDKVIDIGSHMGTITMALSNLVGDYGKVYSFEGERQFFRELFENIKLNKKTNIVPHLCWLSDETNDVLATWYYGSDYSPVHSSEDKPYTLHVRTLDSFQLKDIALIKMDVECMEDQILDGAYHTIMESRPIIFIEIMGGFGNSPMPEVKNRIAHTISKLENMNYKVMKLHIDDYIAIPREKK